MRAGGWAVLSFVASALVAAPPTGAAGDEPTCDPGTETVLEYISESVDGGSGNGPSFLPSISAGGDFVGFSSSATDLGPDSGGHGSDTYVLDLDTDTLEVVSLTPAGTVSDGYHGSAVLTPDGRYAAFGATADDLSPIDTSGTEDVFVRDRELGTTTLMSVGSASSTQQHSGPALISDDGGVVVFQSTRDDLTPADTGQGADLFARVGDTTTLVSERPNGQPANGVFEQFAMTPDGRLVVFEHYVGGDAPYGQIYLHDRTTGESELIAGSSAPSTRAFSPDITDDGGTVVFISSTPGLVPGTGPGFHIYALDLATDDLEVLVEGSFVSEIGDRPERVVISGDGTAIAYQAIVTYRVGTPPDDSLRSRRHIVHLDLPTGARSVLTTTPSGGHPNDESFYPDISDDGSIVVFESWAGNLLPGDGNGREDAFVAWVGSPPSIGPFEDVGGDHTFCVDITWAAGEGITGGFPDGTYRPGEAVSRQAMAAFLFRFAGEPPFDAPDTPTFPDVPASHPFYDEIEWLVSEGITGGLPDGTFGPTEAVSRGSMAAFLHRFAGEPPVDAPDAPTFPDVPTSHVFFDEVEWLVGEEIADGYADGTYRPAVVVSRGSMAAFLHRAA
jgi:Tol biopolymer transport system component